MLQLEQHVIYILKGGGGGGGGAGGGGGGKEAQADMEETDRERLP